MTRPSWDQMGMETARLWSLRSVDPKHKVGTCILGSVTGRVVAVGYNGRAAGESNEREHQDEGFSGYIHSELNALLVAQWSTLDPSHTLYVTLEPCANCARAILNTRRIGRVVYAKPYVEAERLKRNLPRGSEILRTGGLECISWLSKSLLHSNI